MQVQDVAVDQLSKEQITAPARYRATHGHLPPSSAWPILAFLRSEGILQRVPRVDRSPVEQLLAEYRMWLLEERGLAPLRSVVVSSSLASS